MSDPAIQANLEQLKLDYDNWLNDSGIIIIAPPIWSAANTVPPNWLCMYARNPVAVNSPPVLSAVRP